MSWHQDTMEPSLTHRELEVLELVANGYSAKEVAQQIGIAPRTVERHIENVRLKMRARNRAHMITQAILSGTLKVGMAPVSERLCGECLFRPLPPRRDAALGDVHDHPMPQLAMVRPPIPK